MCVLPQYSQATDRWFSLFQFGLLFSLATSSALGSEPATPPQLSGRRPQASSVDAMALIDQRLVRMGTINSDSLSVALENLNDEDSLGYLTQSARTGLVISIFMDGDETPHAISEGALARAVWDRLKALAPAEHDRFVKFLDGLETKKPGDVAGFNVGLATAQRSKFPIDRLIVVIFQHGRSEESAGLLGPAMTGVIADAEHEHLTALVVPSIGYHWEDKNSLEFGQVFKPLFTAMSGSKLPLDVFVTLYSQWPTFVIEDAVRALNHSWAKATAGNSAAPNSARAASGVTRHGSSPE